MSPELIQLVRMPNVNGMKIQNEEKADIFALGVTIYSILTGKYPK